MRYGSVQGSPGRDQEGGRAEPGGGMTEGGRRKASFPSFGRVRARHVGFIAMAAATAACCLVAYSGSADGRRVELKSNFLGEVMGDMTDQKLSPRLAVRSSDYDNIAGNRLDKEAAEYRPHMHQASSDIYDTRAPELKGVKVDSWPWQGMGGGAGGIEGMLPLGFEDKPHPNPMLTTEQRARLEEKNRVREAQLEAQAAAKMRRDRAEMASEGERATHRQQVLKTWNRPLDSHAPPPKKVENGDSWDGHKDKCSDDTPNCNRLADMGFRVNGMPQDLESDTAQAEGDEAAELKNRNVVLATQGLVKMLATDARLARELSGVTEGKGVGEERLAESLQDGVYALEELNELEETSGENKTATGEEEKQWSLFTKGFKWYWLDPERRSLEDTGINVDGLPWAQEEPKVQRWETTLLSELEEGAADMRRVARKDMLAEGEGEGEGEGGARGNGTASGDAKGECSEANPNCHKLEDMGLNVKTWPWARAEREYEAKLGGELEGQMRKAQAVYEMEDDVAAKIERALAEQRQARARHASRRRAKGHAKAASGLTGGRLMSAHVETDKWPWD